MKIVTYLGFTLLSVFIQFSVVDFIQGMLKVDEKPIDLKGTSQKRQLRDVLKDISYKPHALYYRTQKIREIKNQSPAKLLSNVSLTELFATNDRTTTVFEVLYDENITEATEETFTTESLYTSTEIENFTEITFIEHSNETTKSDKLPKKTIIKDCSCNFMLRVCDINCCCDSDCLDSEIKLFPNCTRDKTQTKLETDMCISQLPFFGYGHGLFCIVKMNLPEKQNLVYKKTDQAPMDNVLIWKSNVKSHNVYEYSNKMYKYGDPIWLFKNGSFYHTDLPSPVVNNYCTGRKAIKFLNDEKYRCNVEIGDLEMFQITKSMEETTVISATPLSVNSSVLNCTSLHCVNWSIIACNKIVCTNYSRSLHEPTCTESVCTNFALKIVYIFYYHDSKIIKATTIFHVENITMGIPYISQEIQVKFVLSNESINNILKLSGNPGYIDKLPVIVSYAEINYTDSFYNKTIEAKRYLLLPENKNGACITFNNSENFILFGRNRRIKCRYTHQYLTGNVRNSTGECNNIQNNLDNLLNLQNKILVSPLGNPQQLNDSDWISIQMSSSERVLYGKIQDKSPKLHCFNLITRYLIVFSIGQINGHNRILSCKYETTAKNTTFNLEDVSIVVTIDISFIDVTKPSIVEYSKGPPNLNIHIPDDFFYPFRSSALRALNCNICTMILFIIIISCK